jgi:hypothetical protein
MATSGIGSRGELPGRIVKQFAAGISRVGTVCHMLIKSTVGRAARRDSEAIRNGYRRSWHSGSHVDQEHGGSSCPEGQCSDMQQVLAELAQCVTCRPKALWVELPGRTVKRFALDIGRVGTACHMLVRSHVELTEKNGLSSAREDRSAEAVSLTWGETSVEQQWDRRVASSCPEVQCEGRHGLKGGDRAVRGRIAMQNRWQ